MTLQRTLQAGLLVSTVSLVIVTAMIGLILSGTPRCTPFNVTLSLGDEKAITLESKDK